MTLDTKTICSAITSIINDYEKVNHVISFQQDDKARLKGLEKIGATSGLVLELGSGPGNFTKMLRHYSKELIICLDYSDEMLSVGRSRNKDNDISFLRGVFEALPLKKDAVSFTAAAYAIRDSTDKILAFKEVHRTLKKGGKFLIVDIGKPDNSIVRVFLSLYMRFIMPVLGGLASKEKFIAPWKILYETYNRLPRNSKLLDLIEKTFNDAELDELAFGGLVIATANKRYCACE